MNLTFTRIRSAELTAEALTPGILEPFFERIMMCVQKRRIIFIKTPVFIIGILLAFSSLSTAFAKQLGIWTSSKEISTIPMEGCAWERMKKAAKQADPFLATVSDQDSNNNVQILAAAIVYARSGEKIYKDKVVAAIEGLVSKGKPSGRTLAWGRETAAYVIAADLVEYRTSAFEAWCRNVAEVWIAEDKRTLMQTFKKRPNNWGAHAFGSLSAIYAYLQDHTRLKEIKDLWTQTIIGPKPGETKYGKDLSWHVDKNNLRAINPKNSVRNSINIDGIIPDDMRRGSSFREYPKHTDYSWEYLQGVIVAAIILERMHLPIWKTGDKALLRAAYALQVSLENRYGGWSAEDDDQWLLPFIDKVYGTDWSSKYDPCSSRLYKHGKNAGWGWITLENNVTPLKR